MEIDSHAYVIPHDLLLLHPFQTYSVSLGLGQMVKQI